MMTVVIIITGVVVIVIRWSEEACRGTNLAAEDLVDSGALLQRALRHHLGAHLLHVEHKGVQRLLDVWLFLCNDPSDTDRQHHHSHHSSLTTHSLTLTY